MFQVTGDDIRAGAGILLGVMSIPYSALFYALWLIGRLITPDEERSELGLWFGRFCITMGVVLTSIAVLILARWGDFNPDSGPRVIGTIASLIGGLALLAGIPVFLKMIPLVRCEYEKAMKAGLVGAERERLMAARERDATEREDRSIGRESSATDREGSVTNRETAVGGREKIMDTREQSDV